MKKINLIFFLISISLFLLLIYLINKNGVRVNNNWTFIDYVSVLIICISVFFLFSIFLNKKIKLIILISAISSIMALYIFEIYLSIKYDKIYLQKGSKNKYEIILDLNKKNTKAYLNAGPWLFIKSNGINYKGNKIFPLGGVSNSFTVMNNELGYYPVYKSDKFGFNNSNDNYNKKIINILIGDSFTEGCCVQRENNISEILNKLDLNTVNFGKNGNGPLLEYVTFLEYATYHKPENVIWLYYPNDFKNLKKELKSNFLKQYLDNEFFSQNLINKQKLIDQALINYLDAEEEQYLQKIRDENIDYIKNHWLVKILKLTNSRMEFNLININNNSMKNEFKDEVEIFIEIIKKTKKKSNSWGGKLFFVYLPSILQLNNTHMNDFHETLFRQLENENIKIIDIKKDVFEKHKKPLSLLSNDVGGHFNEKGYSIIANEIYNNLNHQR